jgi:hypothetical protein
VYVSLSPSLSLSLSLSRSCSLELAPLQQPKIPNLCENLLGSCWCKQREYHEKVGTHFGLFIILLYLFIYIYIYILLLQEKKQLPGFFFTNS